MSKTQTVTPDNFRRAESDTTFASFVKRGAFGRVVHNREVASRITA
jgi:hypothetical protein